jgi:hypothetical protein
MDKNLPPLPLEEWIDTKLTLHLYAQIIGKIKLKLMPYKNHWWHITLYVNSRGLGTGPMPYADKLIEINFDFCAHQLAIHTNQNQTMRIDLKDGLCVSEFYKLVFEALSALNVKLKILAKPYEVEPCIPFFEDQSHCSYDKEYILRYWQILSYIEPVFKEFSGRFLGKCSPVHVFWHSFDIAVTRFSGKPAPEVPGANRVNAEAYSHEVISAGFWPGDQNIKEPAFYSYTWPAPEGIMNEPLAPNGKAEWIISNGSPMALLTYENMRQSENPKETLLHFLESAYAAGAKLGNWDMNAFRAGKARF